MRGNRGTSKRPRLKIGSSPTTTRSLGIHAKSVRDGLANGWKTTSIGHCLAIAFGEHHCPFGSAKSASIKNASAAWKSSEPNHLPCRLIWTCTSHTSTKSISPAASAAAKWCASRKSSTAGLTPAPCPMHNGIIHSKTKKNSPRISQPTLSPKESIRRAVGSILCWFWALFCSTSRLTKPASLSNSYWIKMGRKCPNHGAILSIRLTISITKVRMRYAGTCLPSARPGCQRDSIPKALPKFLASFSIPC